MTIKQAFSRSEMVRKKRSTTISSKQTPKPKKSSHHTYQTSSLNNKGGRSTMSRQGVYQPNRRNLDMAYKTPMSKTNSTGTSIPTLGPRLVSAILISIMGFLWINMWNSSAFEISVASLIGNNRLVETDIIDLLPVVGDPVFSVVPDDIERDLRIIFPEIETIDVRVTLPNKIVLKITERIPVVTWVHQNGSQEWIDIHGIAFPIRGQVDGLITVTSAGDPSPSPASFERYELDESTEIENISFIQPQLIENILQLSKLAPQGAAISYDQSYGLGWRDPSGWNVYFGENIMDVTMKMEIYKAIVNKLSQQGIQPSIISVEYLDAPFYRTD